MFMYLNDESPVIIRGAFCVFGIIFSFLYDFIVDIPILIWYYYIKLRVHNNTQKRRNFIWKTQKKTLN